MIKKPFLERGKIIKRMELKKWPHPGTRNKIGYFSPCISKLTK